MVGLALAIAVDLRLLVVGAVAIAAAVLYTGGPRPYGYSGLGELAVLVFFGFVATAGSAYVQLERVPTAAWWGAVAVGLLACAILLANNIRDVDTDRVSGKRTLPVLIGAPAGRGLFVGCVAGAFVAVAAVGVLYPPALIALAALPLAVQPVRLVMARATRLRSSPRWWARPASRSGRRGAAGAGTGHGVREHRLRIGDRAVTLIAGPARAGARPHRSRAHLRPGRVAAGGRGIGA